MLNSKCAIVGNKHILAYLCRIEDA